MHSTSRGAGLKQLAVNFSPGASALSLFQRKKKKSQKKVCQAICVSQGQCLSDCNYLLPSFLKQATTHTPACLSACTAASCGKVPIKFRFFFLFFSWNFWLVRMDLCLPDLVEVSSLTSDLLTPILSPNYTQCFCVCVWGCQVSSRDTLGIRKYFFSLKGPSSSLKLVLYGTTSASSVK